MLLACMFCNPSKARRIAFNSPLKFEPRQLMAYLFGSGLTLAWALSGSCSTSVYIWIQEFQGYFLSIVCNGMILKISGYVSFLLTVSVKLTCMLVFHIHLFSKSRPRSERILCIFSMKGYYALSLCAQASRGEYWLSGFTRAVIGSKSHCISIAAARIEQRTFFFFCTRHIWHTGVKEKGTQRINVRASFCQFFILFSIVSVALCLCSALCLLRLHIL